MTVLARYQRLESLGLWRAGENAQRREVVVSIGEATLLLTELSGRVVTQWSLPALARLNPGDRPAIFFVEGFMDETLEIADEDMIDALEAVMAAVAVRHPGRGRLRLGLMAAGMAAVVFAALFWLPGAISAYVARVAPETVRGQIADSVFSEVQRLTGRACDAPSGRKALRRLETRLFPEGQARLSVLPSVLTDARYLPGRRIVLGSGLVEDFETPEVAAAFITAEIIRLDGRDALAEFLSDLDLTAALRILTSGTIARDDISAWAAGRITEPQPPVEDALLISGLRAQGIAAAPYAYAVDITGETTRSLIQASADTESRSLLEDGDWLALQRICEDRG